MDVVKIHKYLAEYYIYVNSNPFSTEVAAALEIMEEIWPELTGAEQQQVRNILADRSKNEE